MTSAELILVLVSALAWNVGAEGIGIVTLGITLLALETEQLTASGTTSA